MRIALGCGSFCAFAPPALTHASAHAHPRLTLDQWGAVLLPMSAHTAQPCQYASTRQHVQTCAHAQCLTGSKRNCIVSWISRHLNETMARNGTAATASAPAPGASHAVSASAASPPPGPDGTDSTEAAVREEILSLFAMPHDNPSALLPLSATSSLAAAPQPAPGLDQRRLAPDESGALCAEPAQGEDAPSRPPPPPDGVNVPVGPAAPARRTCVAGKDRADSVWRMSRILELSLPETQRLGFVAAHVRCVLSGASAGAHAGQVCVGDEVVGSGKRQGWVMTADTDGAGNESAGSLPSRRAASHQGLFGVYAPPPCRHEAWACVHMDASLQNASRGRQSEGGINVRAGAVGTGQGQRYGVSVGQDSPPEGGQVLVWGEALGGKGFVSRATVVDSKDVQQHDGAEASLSAETWSLSEASMPPPPRALPYSELLAEFRAGTRLRRSQGCVIGEGRMRTHVESRRCASSSVPCGSGCGVGCVPEFLGGSDVEWRWMRCLRAVALGGKGLLYTATRGLVASFAPCSPKRHGRQAELCADAAKGAGEDGETGADGVVTDRHSRTGSEAWGDGDCRERGLLAERSEGREGGGTGTGGFGCTAWRACSVVLLNNPLLAASGYAGVQRGVLSAMCVCVCVCVCVCACVCSRGQVARARMCLRGVVRGHLHVRVSYRVLKIRDCFPLGLRRARCSIMV